ncbi:restriction endonuclease subunit S [Glycomyces sp. MUSA5-2]|uniref:restriction endonuclease subunit S n=1 Tax=Glycomyces sp. MUSA5-2 TaxID=2053002 RepID=UPI0030083E17
MTEAELPPGWVRASLGEIGVEAQPGFASGRHNQNADGVIHLRPMNISRGGKLDFAISKYVQDNSDRRVGDGDVLFNNTNSPELVGKTALVRTARPLAYSNHMTRLRPPSFLLPSYLAYQLHNLWSAGYFRSVLNNHVNQASVATKTLLETPIALPPLAEQERIVDALDGQLSRLDAAVEGLQRAKHGASQLRRSMEHQGITGQLSGPANGDRPVQELLDEIAHVLMSSGSKRRKYDTDEPPIEEPSYPSHWAVRPLGSLCARIEYGTSAKTCDEESDSVPVLRMGNIQGGRIDRSVLKYLPRDHPDVGKLLLKEGDLLFNRTNSAELVGKSAVYHSDLGPMTFASYLIRCRLAAGVEPEWVNLFINSPTGRRYIGSVASQQVGQANVNGTKLANFPIPVPPHEEQLRILGVVEEWETTVGHAISTANQAMRQSERLRQGLLKSAFSGDLVPHDSTDEPAAALLDRNRVERAAQPRPKRGRVSKKTSAASARSAPSVSLKAAGTFVQEELGL